MVLFYHAIGLLLVEGFLLFYEDTTQPASLVFYLLAGPIEETLFFGIPLYATGNHIAVMAGGILWAIIHLLNGPSIQLDALSYGNLLFVIPMIFLSFRTWISGKGWFAIISHSLWNGAVVFPLTCLRDSACIVSSEYGWSGDMILGSIASLLMLVTYYLYRRKVTKLKYTNRERNTNLLIIMFDSEHWFKEAILLILLTMAITIVVSMFIPFPLSYPVVVAVVILIVWRIHKRSRYVPYS
jgi:F0F1-type ATP synthase assembly protein I